MIDKGFRPMAIFDRLNTWVLITCFFEKNPPTLLWEEIHFAREVGFFIDLDIGPLFLVWADLSAILDGAKLP